MVLRRITIGSNRLRSAGIRFAAPLVVRSLYANRLPVPLRGPLRGRGFRPPAPGGARGSSERYTDNETATSDQAGANQSSAPKRLDSVAIRKKRSERKAGYRRQKYLDRQDSRPRDLNPH